MSFSYGSIPPPESPPLRATPLSPAPPARTDRRTKRHTTMDISSGIAGLSLNDGLADDPLDLNNSARRSDSSISSGSSSFSQERAKRQSSAGAIPVPKMINPLPPHYRHPSPAPSSQSSGSVPSLTASRSGSTSTHESTTTSSASSIASSRYSRQSIRPKASQASLHLESSLSTISSSDSLSSDPEPQTPTGQTFSRSRGKSISRAVGKLASDFLSLGKKDRSDVPSVPALPCARK